MSVASEFARPAVASPRRWIGRRTATIGVPLFFVSAVLLAVLDADYRALAFPVLVDVNIAIFFITLLWDRDRRLPVFEIGSVWIAATLVYSTYPFISFLASGLQWNESTDARLLAYEFNLSELAAFAWRYTVYLAAFSTTYLLLRRARRTPLPQIAPPRSALIIAVLVLLAFDLLVKWLMYLVYGLDLDVSYSEVAQYVHQLEHIPYPLWQVTDKIIAATLLAKQALLIVLFRFWRARLARITVFAWLSWEVISVASRLGQRGSAVLLLLSAVLLYHRLVRPLTARALMAFGAALMTGFLFIGIARNVGSYRESAPLKTILTSSNEFQALFATAFDIAQRKHLGTLPPVPWQVYVSDLYLVIPKQLLPFEKIDPALWYLDVMGARGSGVGFMFGVMSQAALGFDWVELVLRGAVLGALFGLLHGWYVRHAASFWATLLYLFITIWAYYTFRATTFWFVHFIVYQFVPFLLGATLIITVLERVRAGAPSRAA